VIILIRLVNSRFKKETDKSVLEFTESISFDYKLALYDIEGSIAHTKMLAKCRIITEREKEMIIDGLNKIKEEIINNQFDYKIELEDIHMNIESRLIEMIGEVGKKLHTARSRNDQIALDLRLYVRDMIKEISKQIIELLIKINKLAGEHIKIIMPGFTHLQPAQPILLSHWLLAYFEKFKRDYIKLKDCYKEVNLCPLGAAALAGTTYKIDREYVAKILGFDGITENSIDSVSDRDFIAHYLFVLSMIGLHFSQISEELIIWSNPYFHFIEIDDAFTTGSSIMPNKKNPDVCELTRAKTGRLFGNLQNILTILKGLPQAYKRDLQEDKIPLFDSTETIIKIIDIYTKMIDNIKFNKKRIEKVLEIGFIEATDLADYLVSKKIPFREAHKITGEIIKYCIANNLKLYKLKLSEFKKFAKEISGDIYKFLNYHTSTFRRRSAGGTSSYIVLCQIEKNQKWLEGESK